MDVFEFYYHNARMLDKIVRHMVDTQTSEDTADMLTTMFERYTKYHRQRALMIISVAFPEMWNHAFGVAARDPKAEEKVKCLRVKMLIQQGEQQLKDNRKKHKELLAAIKRSDIRQKYLKKLLTPTSSAPQPITHSLTG